MICTNPFKLKKPEGGVLELPCGHCLACKIAKSREWASRIIHEMVYYDKSVFVTLTYDNLYCPENNSIDVSTLQRFIKRLRKISNLKLRYFGCGEYGDRLHRPHYHLIIFGIGRSDVDKSLIEKAWPFGFVYLGSVTFQSARYVARYIEKKYNGKKEEEEYKKNKKKKNIEERKLEFSHTLKPFLDTYGKDLLNSFYKYWTEPNKSNTKFKQELEKTWSLERRLETWSNNERNFNKPENTQPQSIAHTREFKL